MSSTKKQITFDIDTNVAKQILGTNYTKVYDDIERSLKNYFDHPQGSVYVSKKPMTVSSVYIHISSLLQKYPYIKKCVRDISFTNSPKKTSLNYMFSYDGTAKEYKTDTKVKRESKIFYSHVTSEQLKKLIDSGIPFEMKRSPTDCMIRYSSEHRDKVEKILSSVKKQNRQTKR